MGSKMNKQAELMKRLMVHANRAINVDHRTLKRRVAVRSPQGGFRMEVQVITK